MSELTSTTWKAFGSNEITHSGAHYLLAVATQGNDAPARAVDVARALGVSRAATSVQLRNLRDAGLVERTRDHRWRLTTRGGELVARVAGKREVVRVFLQDILGVRPATADTDACKIEHLLSEETGAAIVRLVRFLRSSEGGASACLRRFREMTASCPPGARCELCSGVCLLAAGESERSHGSTGRARS